MKLTKEEDQIVQKFLQNIIDEGGKDFIKLTQFMILRWSQEAIDMNAGEMSLSQTISHKREEYRTRMSIQYSKVGEKTLEERADELVDCMMSTISEDCDIREELKKAALAGYSLHIEDFDDEQGVDD